MRPTALRLVLPLIVVCTACLGRALSGPDGGAPPWPLERDSWRTDPTWYDGRAEVARYAARREIYGRTREYQATAYTNKQAMDPVSTTKAADGEGIEVFKHHWSERVPTERYDYDFSTAVFTRTEDLSTYKYTAATQEDCGASFKQAWDDGGGWNGMESVYFPDAGARTFRRDGALPLPHDSLTLVLRDLAGRASAGETLEAVQLPVLPTQRSTKRVRWDAEPLRVAHRGQEELDTALGRLATQVFELADATTGELRARYWFAADGGPPLLNVLVRYEDPTGLWFELTAHDRYAYWERGPLPEGVGGGEAR